MAKVISAGIFIVKNNGKLLICHPTNHGQDSWSIPKGKVDEGEEIITAALRETFEECNIDLTDKEISKHFQVHCLEGQNYSHRKKIIFPFLYLENKDSYFDWENQVLQCNSNVPIDRGGFPEMDDYKWIDLDEAVELLHPTQFACIDLIKNLIL